MLSIYYFSSNKCNFEIIIISNEKDDGSLCLSWLDVLTFDKPKKNFFQNWPIVNFGQFGVWTI